MNEKICIKKLMTENDDGNSGVGVALQSVPSLPLNDLVSHRLRRS